MFNKCCLHREERQRGNNLFERRSDNRFSSKITDTGCYLFRLLVLLLLVIPSIWSCSTDNDKIVCCQDILLEYRYVRQERDEYKMFVQSMRHFLFDEQGLFVKELPSSTSNPQRLRLSDGLSPEHRYTVLTIGNATKELTKLNELVEQQLSLANFKLAVAGKFDANSYANSDQLFWNAQTFKVEQNSRQRYVCDLANIHCHLFVKIRWNKRPPYTGGKYTLELDRVPTDYNLSPDKVQLRKTIRPDAAATAGVSTDKQVVHAFPRLGGAFGKHRVKQSLFGTVLYGDFITLRYTNKHLPTFRLYYGDEAVSKPIDLSKAFASWGWRPDELPEQIYYIEMEIFEDGTVVVKQWAQTSVKDWIDGGTIGT